MNRQAFIAALGAEDVFPEEAITTCLENPDECIPSFLLLLEREARGLKISREEERALFFATHLLAAFRVGQAFAPLTEILCNSGARAAALFQDCLGDSIPMVLMAIGPGKAVTAWDCVASPQVDWVVREAYMRHWTYEALQERIEEPLIVERLRNFPSKVAPEPESYLWAAWMTAIADLGLSEVAPLVENLFETGHIAKDEFGYLPVDRAAFSEDLAEALRLRNQGALSLAKAARSKGYRPFGPELSDFLSAARHILPIASHNRAATPYPAPLLRVAEPDKDFTP